MGIAAPRMSGSMSFFRKNVRIGKENLVVRKKNVDVAMAPPASSRRHTASTSLLAPV